MSAILSRLRQENHKFEVSLVYRTSLMTVLGYLITLSQRKKKNEIENIILLNKMHRHYKSTTTQFRATAQVKIYLHLIFKKIKFKLYKMLLCVSKGEGEGLTSVTPEGQRTICGPVPSSTFIWILGPKLRPLGFHGKYFS